MANSSQAGLAQLQQQDGEFENIWAWQLWGKTVHLASKFTILLIYHDARMLTKLSPQIAVQPSLCILPCLKDFITVEVFGSDQYLKQAGKPSINKHKKLFIWISRSNSVNRKVLLLESYCHVYTKVIPFKLYYILQKHFVAWYVHLIPLLYHGTTVMFSVPSNG